jgi:hypothetical protein
MSTCPSSTIIPCARSPPGSSSRSRCMRGKHQADRARRRRHMLHPGRSFVSFLIPGRWLDRHHRDRRRARAHDDDDARQKSARPFRFSSPCGKPYGRRARRSCILVVLASISPYHQFRRFACRVFRAVPSQAAKPGDRPSSPQLCAVRSTGRELTIKRKRDKRN